MQLKYLGALLDWLARQNEASEGGRLSGLLDLGRVGVAGHSRGAKLAALHFAGDQQSHPTSDARLHVIAMS
jgi:predicted dienelactone hydrolase